MLRLGGGVVGGAQVGPRASMFLYRRNRLLYVKCALRFVGSRMHVKDLALTLAPAHSVSRPVFSEGVLIGL